jgi:hypothetical protein
MALPDGLVQGASYFSVQNGMGVISCAGRLYRLRIAGSQQTGDYYEEIALADVNSENQKRVWMCQTVDNLVVQDFLSDPIIYDGSTARRSNTSANEVPRGKQMAYGNGRLWVAINEKTLAAGDIYDQGSPGSELLFTETNNLLGGGTITFPDGIRGLAFIPVTGTSDVGALTVGSLGAVNAIRADITDRDQWGGPGFITTILRSSGMAGQSSIVQVNQDLYWRDGDGGIRSLRSGMADESGPGNSPISMEVTRLTSFDSQQLLEDCPAVNFNNRLLMGSSPFLNANGGVSWKALVALDFAPVSTMQGKSAPEYDGEWAGLNVTHAFAGKINGVHRAFFIHCSEDGENSLWELLADDSGAIADKTLDCDTLELADYRVTSFYETRRDDFGEPSHRKELKRIDVYLSEILGRVDVELYWRTDNNQKWQKADEMTFCAQVNDPVIPGETSHVWKNLRPQQRSQVKSFSLPVAVDPITKFSFTTGFQFQYRVVWTGHCQIHMLVTHAAPLDETPFAMRVQSEACLANNVT